MNAAGDAQPASGGRLRRWLKRLIPVLLVLAAATLVGVIALLPKNKEPLPPSKIPPVNVKVQRVRPIPELADTLDLTAIVEPNRVVRVAAEVAGQIERFGRRRQAVAWNQGRIPEGATVQEGEPVSEGQPLVHLNKDLLQARYDRALAQFEYDEREYQRILDLYERGVTSRTELDDAGTHREVAKASLDEAARNLERTTIAAPISGILNRLPKEVGEYVSSGDEVAEIVDIETVKVVVDVPERDVHFLEVGDGVEVLVRPPQEQVLDGEITYVSVLADEGTRTTRVEITVDNRDRRLRSGQIVRARLTRRVLKDVFMIPLAAVIPLENGRVVYVVNDDHAERREVELDFIRGHSVRVLSGLATGDRLIVAGHRYVGPGQAVNIIDTNAEPPSPANQEP